MQHYEKKESVFSGASVCALPGRTRADRDYCCHLQAENCSHHSKVKIAKKNKYVEPRIQPQRQMGSFFYGLARDRVFIVAVRETYFVPRGSFFICVSTNITQAAIAVNMGKLATKARTLSSFFAMPKRTVPQKTFANTITMTTKEPHKILSTAAFCSTGVPRGICLTDQPSPPPTTLIRSKRPEVMMDTFSTCLCSFFAFKNLNFR